MARLALFAVATLLALSGCSSLRDAIGGPGPDVSRTKLEPGTWNDVSKFVVEVAAPGGDVRIVANEVGGSRQLSNEGWSAPGHPVELVLQEGTWDVSYYVDGKRRETFRNVKIDHTAPQPVGLEPIGSAQDGRYTIGANVQVEAGALVRVVDAQTGALLSSTLPYTATGLVEERIYSFLVAFGDEAGNWNNQTVQVRVGGANALPERGAYTFGIVARYTNDIQLWELGDLGAYLTPEAARAEVGGAYLGSGYRIWPNNTAVSQVVGHVVRAEHATTAQVAWALYGWLADNLEYDEVRLSATDLLKPQDTLQRGGGVCRDLAGLYVSLLRAAGVPARLVSGYVSGDVNSFHAWVEFYGGSVGGKPAWVPVDVSPIDGPADTARILSAFGILRPDYLMLRIVPESAESEGWSTALSVRYQYSGPEPRFSFEKSVQPTAADQVAVLCVDVDTLRRFLAATPDDCPRDGFDQYFRDFVKFTERIIDYGIHMERASGGDRVTAEVAYPFAADAHPNAVEFVAYGRAPVGGWTVDAQGGRYVAQFTV